MFAVAVENPETDVVAGTTLAAGLGVTTGTGCSESGAANVCEAADNVPDFTARLRYDAPGGHKFEVAGVARNLRIDADTAAAGVTGSDSEFAWGLVGAAQFNLADVATLSAIATYGDGMGRYTRTGGNNSAVVTGTPASPNLQTIEAWGVSGWLGFGVTDTTTVNLVLSYFDQANSDIVAGQTDDLMTVHANVYWQPVNAFRFGFETIWGNHDAVGAGTNDALRFQFGAQFYF